VCSDGSNPCVNACFGGRCVERGCLDGGSTDGDAAPVTDALPPSDAGPAALCTSTGGTIVTHLCCASQQDFPNSCLIGSCSCSPANSHNVSACSCPALYCFDPALGCVHS
jgi:hypothetical protein